MATVTSAEAEALVRGPLGDEMAKFPLRFAKPAYFGDPPSRENPLAVNSGTVSLINVGNGLLAITCFHVIEAYREKRRESDRCIFMIGNCQLDPVAQLIAEDRAVDVATIRLTDAQAAEIIHGGNGFGEALFHAGAWPPDPVAIDNYVAFGGFPGELRRVESFNELNFGSYSSGAARITDTHADYFVCAFEREHWIRQFQEAEPVSLGGLSGGPVFLIRHSNGVMSYDFAGVIYQIHEERELLTIRQARAIPLGNYFA